MVVNEEFTQQEIDYHNYTIECLKSWFLTMPIAFQKISLEILSNCEEGESPWKLPRDRYIPINEEEAKQALQWWGLSHLLYTGQELAKKLEEFVTSNQSKKTD